MEYFQSKSVMSVATDQMMKQPQPQTMSYLADSVGSVLDSRRLLFCSFLFEVSSHDSSAFALSAHPLICLPQFGNDLNLTFPLTSSHTSWVVVVVSVVVKP